MHGCQMRKKTSYRRLFVKMGFSATGKFTNFCQKYVIITTVNILLLEINIKENTVMVQCFYIFFIFIVNWQNKNLWGVY